MLPQPEPSHPSSIQQYIYRPVIAFMTDFGTGDGYISVMKGIVVTIIPDVQIIDITHEVAPQNVSSGAWILATSYRYFPQRTIFVCVIDPGVGSARRAIAVHAGDWYFVGPDNGLFSYIFAEQPIHGAVSLTNPAYHLSQVSSTFHGRDIFAPIGAHLARGVGLSELGTSLDPATLQRMNIEPPTRYGTDIEARILHVDNFGDLITSIPLSMVPDLFTASHVRVVFPVQDPGAKSLAPVEKRSRSFAGGEGDGTPFIYGDSSGYVGIAVRNGNAAKTLGVGYGAKMTFVIADN